MQPKIATSASFRRQSPKDARVLPETFDLQDDVRLETVDPGLDRTLRGQIAAFLGRSGLAYEEGIETFVVALAGERLVGCAGLQGNIVKCVAVEPGCRGGALCLALMQEVLGLAQDRGINHLFLYTKPGNAGFFESCGFYPLVEVPDQVTLFENTPAGVRLYCRRLSALRRPGKTIGSIVMNGNPFTLGHRHLVREAAAVCDWLHVFVVAEDTALISYRDRYRMVEAGIASVDRVTLHHGSQYSVSCATFPAYFFKEKGLVGPCCTAIDQLLFRNYIAPALGVTHRFVGTEPFCPVTRKYNADMKFWLRHAPTGTPALQVVEIARAAHRDTAISASQVRRLLAAGDFAGVAELVPASTLRILRKNYTAAAGPVGGGTRLLRGRTPETV
jgi:[citrate (pro-3S)-lyase] ligase